MSIFKKKNGTEKQKKEKPHKEIIETRQNLISLLGKLHLHFFMLLMKDCSSFNKR